MVALKSISKELPSRENRTVSSASPPSMSSVSFTITVFAMIKWWQSPPLPTKPVDGSMPRSTRTVTSPDPRPQVLRSGTDQTATSGLLPLQSRAAGKLAPPRRARFDPFPPPSNPWRVGACPREVGCISSLSPPTARMLRWLGGEGTDEASADAAARTTGSLAWDRTGDPTGWRRPGIGARATHWWRRTCGARSRGWTSMSIGATSARRGTWGNRTGGTADAMRRS